MKSEWYQYTLIAAGIAVTVFFGMFWHRELFPEYKIYQNDYIALEKFRSSYTGETPPLFKGGVAQIVLEREDKGPAVIDRCTSCHVALQIPDFSPTKLQHDSNGKLVLDSMGRPVQIPNENYIWTRLDAAIAHSSEAEAEKYRALKTAQVDGHVYDVTKVLRMHPLMGRETRPFEYHPIEEYGCTSCHNGNGRGLTTERAHGPIFDGFYEVESHGPEPKFTESDPGNDPPFAREFNAKPGAELLFQTTPIYVGALIQAKCINCHQDNVGTLRASSASSADKISPTMQSQVDLLTSNYHRGQELYISQACYACHRIAGLARGGVGPELTRTGLNYPWFLKESMVWPQADLSTSTMPNYALDHEELEDLMTFMLAQIGQRKSTAETAYKIAIQKWEAGKKMPWELPITPDKVQDLNYSMKVFATEGCAACHRLEGFQSDVGYRIEKESKAPPSFDALYKEKEWFTSLFPEEIVGSDLVKVLEKQSDEIDRHIVDNVRQGSILEQINAIVPGQVESLYTSFKYAARAKNHHYQVLADQEKDPEKRNQLLAELKAWKERVRRVLMMYVQEYGLGRLVGPRPNWSGVFRTDEWLMEHFHNPGGHVPRSIMPVFPFDDSKFYALTYMLDVLGKQNRDKLRAIWDNRGFSPEQAFQFHCSQCHGPYLQGNGPVAPWIYPIPKNLRNADFLRNLTKERVIQSITHGVKGTPMPPWGEVAAHKPMMENIPVLNTEEIQQLTDWIFGSLPGGTVIKGAQDVPKWNYTPEDVLRELDQEGNILKEGPEAPVHEQSQAKPAPARSDIAVLSTNEVAKLKPSDVFDIVPNPLSGPDKQAYFIKKKYYTQQNIEQGKAFFELNCAVCHGAEADGTGPRASEMKEAKPRMLVNLDWGNYRDDLRLLRSIKYGVPGTAMTPWGDLTSSLQRLQLVLFIRSLTQEQRLREKLSTALYHAYDHSILAVEDARIHEYPALAKVKEQLNQLQMQREIAYNKVEMGNAPTKEALETYQKELDALADLKKHQDVDEMLKNLKAEVAHEKEVYQRLGLTLLKLGNEEDFNTFLKIVSLSEGRYEFQEGKLKAIFDGEKEKQREEFSQEILSDIPEKTRVKVLADLDAAVRSRQKQQQLYEAYSK